MTMYNEDDVLFLRTLNAVIKNIAHLTTRTRSKTWGAESWQKVVVCIVADGRKVIDSRVLKILQLMGVYAEVSPLYCLPSSFWTPSFGPSRPAFICDVINGVDD